MFFHPLIESHPRELRRPASKGQPASWEYLLPTEAKHSLCLEIYPYLPRPGPDDVMYDLFAQKTFRFSEFRVVKEGNVMLLVSPYYYESGATVFECGREEDLVSDDDEELLPDDGLYDQTDSGKN